MSPDQADPLPAAVNRNAPTELQLYCVPPILYRSPAWIPMNEALS
jgi:hypothetical protein